MRATIIASVLSLACLIAGCAPSGPPKFRLNDVELLKRERESLAVGEHFANSYREQVGNLLIALFGTPDDPRFPFPLGEEDPAHEILSVENLKLAAGPVSSDRRDKHSGLYREHCAHCHGISGDGAGPTAGMLNPYPRDFRLGKFKFKDSPLRRPPTDDALAITLRRGIPGTGMPSFQSLSDEHIDALVDYVKYLSIRGEFERYLMAEIPRMGGEPLIDLEELARAGTDENESLDDQLFTVVGDWLSEQVVARWLKPEKSVTPVPPMNPGVAPGHPEHTALVAQGRTLFHTKANCVQCHGDTGLGDGQTENYDDWTNEWLKTPGVLGDDSSTWTEFLAAGALPPRKIRPRNLNLPVYRGGGSPEEMFVRIRNGIEGTPMPSTPETLLNNDETWAVVAFVRSLPYANGSAAVKQPDPSAGSGSPSN